MSYRDDLEAAKERRNALAHELRTIENEMTQLEVLDVRRREIERELQITADILDRARARTSLPLLSRVRVASPCNATWDRMRGDDRVRFCGQCDKSVFDLSAMTAAQAEALLEQHGASLCVRFYRRRDGTVLTTDCPVGKSQRRGRKVAAAVLAGGLMAAAGAGYLATSTGETSMGTPKVEHADQDVEKSEARIGQETLGGMTKPAPEDPEAEYEMLMGDFDWAPEPDDSQQYIDDE